VSWPDVDLTWDASPTAGVTEYSVRRRTGQTGEPIGEASEIARTAATEYTDEGVADGEYDYQVYGVVPD
jgi:hypothetical protein